MNAPEAAGRRLPAAIWVLGFVSLLMDISSEMIHSLLPVFMVSTLGASASMIGLVEGVAEATALIGRAFSGALSDATGKRKVWAVIGYGLSAITKPLFALATGVGSVLVARFCDRVGKGLRGAPRDALIADITTPTQRGAAYGLRQALDTVGAMLGPLLAIVLMLALHGDFRAVFWVAVLPAALSVVVLGAFVREPSTVGSGEPVQPVSRESLRRLPRALWLVVAVGVIFTLARFSEAFLVLRGQQAGLTPAWAPLVMVGMSGVYALSANPFGLLADRLDRTLLLGVGLLTLIAADLALAFVPGLSGVAVGVALWGLHMGMTQGLLSAMVADAAPADLRGSAFGLFSLASGLAMLGASVIAGVLWDRFGASATFAASALFAAIAGIALLAARRTSTLG
jgi:MFS family permease